MMIKDLGTSVESVWDGLRPVTKNLIAGALKTGTVQQPSHIQQFFYDAHADWEVSRLLTALDERSKTPDIIKDVDKLNEIEQLADTCVLVLEDQTASAEVFIMLARRALQVNDYDQLENLADLLAERFASSEIAEVIRQTDQPQIRAIACETLTMLPVSVIASLLDDPIYAGIATMALEQKAFEFESDEARDVLEQYDAENDVNES